MSLRVLANSFIRSGSVKQWFGSFFGLVALFSWLSGCTVLPVQKPQRWAAYYGETINWQSFEQLDLVVFDADKHPNIKPLKLRGVKVLAYLSVAEIAPYRGYANEMLQLPDFVIGKQECWNSSIVDIRNTHWQQHILDVQIPAILAEGFDGVMIDTVDSALSEYSKNPISLSGTPQAIVSFIHQIRQKLPAKSMIMVNRGFEILPEIVADIDIALAESILIDAHQPQLHYFDDHVYQSYVDRLQQLRYKNTHLSIFTLDYLSIQDMKAREKIESVQRSNGFSPYVATLDLQTLQPFAMLR